MKSFTFLSLLFILLLSITVYGQEDNSNRRAATSFAYGHDFKACMNSNVNISIVIVDLQNNEEEVYIESHTTTTNEVGQYSFYIGGGTVLKGLFDLKYLVEDTRYEIRTTIQIDCNGTILEENGTVLKSPWAANAENASTWGGYKAPPENAITDSLQQLDIAARSALLLLNPETKTTQGLRLNELLQGVRIQNLNGYQVSDPLLPKDVADFLQSSEELHIAQDIAGNKFIKGNTGIVPVQDYPELIPIKYNLSEVEYKGTTFQICSPAVPFEDQNLIYYNGKLPWQDESQVAYNISHLGVLSHGFAVTISDPNTPDHNTAAAYFNNPLGTTGILTTGLNYGIYAQGNNGGIGIPTNPDITSVGFWGYVPQLPSSGQFSIGLIGDANGFSAEQGVYGMTVYGDALVTNNLVVGSLTETSDARLKESIHPAEASLDNILKLQPKVYRFIRNSGLQLPEGDRIGFLAQDLEKVYPQLVKEYTVPHAMDPDNPTADVKTETYKTINYSALIPILTKAIQELNDKVEKQEQKIIQLTETIETLNKK